MNKRILGFLTFCLLTTLTFAQTCPANYNPAESYKWPTHTNWYFGQAQIMTFGVSGTGAPSVSTKVGAGAPFTAYESCASASDEQGNLIFYTNGVGMWDANGANIAIPGGRLLTGAENPTGNAGSAVQGVLIAKHPLDVDRYYIFTTDDAIGGESGITNGFNYYVYTRSTNTLTGPTRLGNYRTTEQVAATWHNNGIDVWISTHESVPGSATQNYHSYLLSCSGLNTTPVTSATGFSVTAVAGPGGYANERSSLEFQETDGATQVIKAAATHHCGNGTWDPVNSVSILDFDNLAGTFTLDQGLGDGSVAASNPYDCEFSPDGSRIFVSFQSDQWSGPLLGRVGYYPIGGGGFTEVVNTGSGTTDIGALETGGDGNIYGGGFAKNPWGYLNGLTVISNPNGASSGTVGGFATAASGVGYGVPNIFIPPRDWLEIQPVPAITECDMPYNLQTQWLCKGTDAENTPLYEDAYRLLNGPAGATVDSRTGVVTGGAGSYEVEFIICTIGDTITFTVGTCGCNADVSNNQEICAGQSIMLDSLLTASSGAGEWSLDSIPSGTGSLPSIDAAGGDTTFNTVANARPGTYKLMYSVTGASCKDSLYITVNAIPTPSIVSVGPLCIDAAAVALQGSPQNGADTTGVWKINGAVSAAGSFDPASLGAGLDTVNYEVTVKGCTADVDSVFRVNQLPVVTVNDSTICAGGPQALFTASSDSTAASYLWSDQGTGTVVSTTGTTAGNYVAQVTDVNGCVSSGTGVLTVTPLPTPSVTAMGPYCANDPVVAMSGTPASGAGTTVVWKINDVVNAAGSFDPAAATVGANTVRYIATVNNCTDSTDISVTVNPLKDATITTTSGRDTNNYCVFDPNPTITVAEGGGTWDNANVSMVGTTATIDLTGLGTVTNERLIYSLADPCGAQDTIWVTTTSALDATITQVGPYCDDDTNTVSLSAVDGGGTWHGTGILNTNSGTFRPSAAGAGTHTIEYRIGGACGDTSTIDILVEPKADATITTADATLCEYDAAMSIATVVAGGTWTELTPTNGGFDATASSFNPTTAGDGVYRLEYSFGGNCPDRDTIEITVIDTADIQITPQANLCANDNPVNLVVTPAGGTWSGNGVDGAGLFTPSAAVVGTQTLTYAIGGSCPVQNTTTVTVDANKDATLPAYNPVCEGDPSFPIVPTVDAGGTFTATCGGCIDAVTGVFDPAVATAGTHTVTYTLANPCGDTKTTSIVVQAPEAITITPVPSICEGVTGTVTVNVTPAGGTWSGAVSTAGVFDPNGKTPAGSPYTGTYSYTTSAGCTSTESIDISMLVAPAVDFSGISGCIPLTSPFTDLTDVSQVAVQTSSWTFGNGSSSSDQLSTSAVYTTAGLYTVSLTNIYANGCSSSATKNSYVNAYAIPTAEFTSSPQPASVLDPRVSFTNVSIDGDTYEWDFSAKGNPATSTDMDPSVIFSSTEDDTISVQLIAISVNGCVDTVVHPVIIEDIFTVYVPNAFTPGSRNDGLNDTFYPQGKNWALDDYEFVVLDRWGNLIYKTNTIGEGWDGTVNGFLSGGDVAQIDVYVWKLTVKNKYTNKKYKKVGTVTLVR